MNYITYWINNLYHKAYYIATQKSHDYTAILSDEASEAPVNLFIKSFLAKDINSRPIYFYDAYHLTHLYPRFIKTQNLLLINFPAYKKLLQNKEDENFETIYLLVNSLLSKAENMTDDKLISILKKMGYIDSAQTINQHIYENSSDEPTSYIGINNYEKKLIQQLKNNEIKEFLENFPKFVNTKDEKSVEVFSINIMNKMSEFNTPAFYAVIHMINGNKLESIVKSSPRNKAIINNLIHTITISINDLDCCTPEKRLILIGELSGYSEIIQRKLKEKLNEKNH